MRVGRVIVGLVVLVSMLAMGCERRAQQVERAKSAPTTSSTVSEAEEGPGGEPTSAPADEDASQCSAQAQLSKMDPRKPVPLQPMMAWHQKQNMQDHLKAIQEISAALAEEDWEGVKEASSRIESSPQMQQMCQHMGAGAPGFTEMALQFHKNADQIAPAADSKDSAAVMAAMARTLGSCNGCHSAYRQEIVDAKTWSARTGSSHEPGEGMHHGGKK